MARAVMRHLKYQSNNDQCEKNYLQHKDKRHTRDITSEPRGLASTPPLATDPRPSTPPLATSAQSFTVSPDYDLLRFCLVFSR